MGFEKEKESFGMDRKSIKLYFRFSGSTILEVVVSMVIISLVLGISLGIFTNIQRSSPSSKKIQVEAILNDEKIHLQGNVDTTSSTYTLHGYKIVRTWLILPDNSSLKVLDLKGFDKNDSLIAEIKTVEYE